MKEDEAAEVEILKIEVVCEDRPKGNITLDFQGEHVGKHAHRFVIKEGSIYNLRVFFNVKYDIVYGLKMVNNVYKTFMKGKCSSIQCRKTNRRWDRLLRNKSHMCLIWRKSKLPQGFWREEITKERCCLRIRRVWCTVNLTMFLSLIRIGIEAHE